MWTDELLSRVAARVVGCLLEKERTVPDQYPLTLNALVTACNQTTSRDPVMHLDEHEVEAALAGLKADGLVRMVHPSHGRSVTRYRQVADERWKLERDAAAVMAVLLLRGPQTVNELRTRTERQHSFDGPAEVQAVLDQLAERGMVHLLDRQPGQKEPRWQQLVADEPEPSERVVHAVTSRGADAAETAALTARVTELEDRVARLEAALAELL
jgi:uncharacterized protein YceH (UPF0502 family)